MSDTNIIGITAHIVLFIYAAIRIWAAWAVIKFERKELTKLLAQGDNHES